MKRRVAWAVVTAGLVVVLGSAAVAAVALLIRGGAPLGWSGGRQFLSVDIDGEIPEEAASGIAGLLETRPPSLLRLIEAIDRAGQDPKVEGLLLRLGSVDVGWARITELREALLRFRRSGKPSWAHLESAGNREYFLATGCRKIAASPTAMLDVSGLAAEVTFFKGALDKLGVQAQFEGVGKYKNAPNQFTESGFTAPHREQMEALVGSLFQGFVDGVAKARGHSPDEVRTLIDQGPFDASAAKAAGLVDDLLYRDQVEERIGVRQSVGPGRYLRTVRGFGVDSRPQLAIVYAVGTIVPGESDASPVAGGLAGAETIVRGLRDARASSAIRAVILRVDSPGGSGTASDAVWREVALVRAKKPVVVSMGDYAASGGYYISMGADAIVAEASSITGSIGVFSGKFSLRGLYGKLGLSEGVVQRGRHARLFSSSEPWTDEERAQVRAMNRQFYDTFVRKAAEGRHRTVQEIEGVAQGRVWTGEQARAAGLVDSLGGIDTAIEIARTKARLPKGQSVRLIVMPKAKGFLETVLERQESQDAVAAVAGRRAARIVRWAAVLGDGRPVARLPYDLAVE